MNKKQKKAEVADTTSKAEDEDLEQKIIDWTKHNPETLIYESTEGAQLCKDLKFYIEHIKTKNTACDDIDDELETINVKMQNLANNYDRMVYKIKMWWKYSRIDLETKNAEKDITSIAKKEIDELQIQIGPPDIPTIELNEDERMLLYIILETVLNNDDILKLMVQHMTKEGYEFGLIEDTN